MRLTVSQLRRIIKEEVSHVMEMGMPAAGGVAPKKKAAVMPGVDAETKQAARDIKKIVGQGQATDYVSVAKIVTDFLNYRYPGQDDPNIDVLGIVTAELSEIMEMSDGRLDFDPAAVASAIDEEFMLA